jgi:hypothetical protein
MTRNVDVIGYYCTVQSLVKQQVGVAGEVLPLCEGTRLLFVARRLGLVMQVLANATRAALPVVSELLFQFR